MRQTCRSQRAQPHLDGQNNRPSCRNTLMSFSPRRPVPSKWNVKPCGSHLHTFLRTFPTGFKARGGKTRNTQEQTTIYSNFHAYNALAHFSGVSQNAWSLLPGPP